LCLLTRTVAECSGILATTSVADIILSFETFLIVFDCRAKISECETGVDGKASLSRLYFHSTVEP